MGKERSRKMSWLRNILFLMKIIGLLPSETYLLFFDYEIQIFGGVHGIHLSVKRSIACNVTVNTVAQYTTCKTALTSLILQMDHSYE